MGASIQKLDQRLNQIENKVTSLEEDIKNANAEKEYPQTEPTHLFSYKYHSPETISTRYRPVPTGKQVPHVIYTKMILTLYRYLRD